MNFDLRLPLGLLFSVFGLILVGTGLLGGPELAQKSLGINMNLWWGLIQLLFGVGMLYFSLKRQKQSPPTRDAEAEQTCSGKCSTKK
ncbi:MAG: hypothetical protein WCO68_11245 [Verrucomicrobiota bacterium]